MKRKYPRGFIVLLAGISLIMIASIVTFFTVSEDVAWMISTPGTVLWVVAVYLWVVIVDSRKRWPGVPLYIRAGRVMFMHRDK